MCGDHFDSRFGDTSLGVGISGLRLFAPPSTVFFRAPDEFHRFNAKNSYIKKLDSLVTEFLISFMMS